MAGIQYSIRKNRWDRAVLSGMEPTPAGVRSTNEQTDHYFVLSALDSGMEDCKWGRLKFSLQLEENSVFYLYAAASNDLEAGEGLFEEQASFAGRKAHFSRLSGVRFINQSDVLLYGLEGRYLWIGAELIGTGASVSDMKVLVPGDNFMQVFPEVYRERNSFFHRYISVYSSLYNDFQEQIDQRDQLYDIASAKRPQLELFLKWLGIDVRGGFLEEELLRQILSEAGELLKKKGTRSSVERLCEIMTGETPVIVERGRMQPYLTEEEREVSDRLYGNSPYDVTLMIRKPVSERRRQQLLHLLGQFKPVRCRLHIVFLESRSTLDGYTYLDQNAVSTAVSSGNLDTEQILNDTVILE